MNHEQEPIKIQHNSPYYIISSNAECMYVLKEGCHIEFLRLPEVIKKIFFLYFSMFVSVFLCFVLSFFFYQFSVISIVVVIIIIIIINIIICCLLIWLIFTDKF